MHLELVASAYPSGSTRSGTLQHSRGVALLSSGMRWHVELLSQMLLPCSRRSAGSCMRQGS